MITNYAAGHKAERVAAERLTQNGFEVIDMNWKTKVCEIDIIARKEHVLYFIEVKYRKTTKQGQGLDYITEQKIKRMGFAAELWVAVNNWQGEFQLAAVEVSGKNYAVNKLITEIG